MISMIWSWNTETTMVSFPRKNRKNGNPNSGINWNTTGQKLCKLVIRSPFRSKEMTVFLGCPKLTSIKMSFHKTSLWFSLKMGLIPNLPKHSGTTCLKSCPLIVKPTRWKSDTTQYHSKTHRIKTELSRWFLRSARITFQENSSSACTRQMENESQIPHSWPATWGTHRKPRLTQRSSC